MCLNSLETKFNNSPITGNFWNDINLFERTAGKEVIRRISVGWLQLHGRLKIMLAVALVTLSFPTVEAVILGGFYSNFWVCICLYELPSRDFFLSCVLCFTQNLAWPESVRFPTELLVMNGNKRALLPWRKAALICGDCAWSTIPVHVFSIFNGLRQSFSLCLRKEQDQATTNKSNPSCREKARTRLTKATQGSGLSLFQISS